MAPGSGVVAKRSDTEDPSHAFNDDHMVEDPVTNDGSEVVEAATAMEATDEEVTLVTLPLDDWRTPSMACTQPPQPMTMQQAQMAVNTLMTGGVLDLRWARFTAGKLRGSHVWTCPSMGSLLGFQWSGTWQAVQSEASHPHSWGDAFPRAGGDSTNTRTCQAGCPMGSQEMSEEDEEVDPSVHMGTTLRRRLSSLLGCGCMFKSREACMDNLNNHDDLQPLDLVCLNSTKN